MRIQLAQPVEKILRSRIFSFLCIRLYVIEKEDRAEETHQGGLFCFSSKPPLHGAHIIYSSKKASRRRLFS